MRGGESVRAEEGYAAVEAVDQWRGRRSGSPDGRWKVYALERESEKSERTHALSTRRPAEPVRSHR